MKQSSLNLQWRRLLTLIFFVGCTAVALAQSRATGVVTDETGETMPGVTVTVKGTTTKAITDLDGNFTIDLGKGNNATLSFSFLGYITEERKVTSGQKLKITLKEDNKQLDEVVVVGYQDVRKRDLTGSVAKVDLNNLLAAPVSSFDQSLGGRVAGVNVTSNEGQPGGMMNIVIRGNNSLTQENSPLYVVDGFPVEDPRIAQSINPADIQSLNILKDASATAIYGARGANGVVIITTKSGSEGRMNVSYDFSYGKQYISKQIKMMDAYEFVKLQQENYPSAMSQTYFQTIDGKTWTLDDYKNIPQYNWQDLIFKDAPVQSHNVSLSGGGKDVRYNASLSYYDQDGIVLHSNYNRLQGRLGTTLTRNKWTVNLNINYSRVTQNGSSPSQSSWSGMNNLFYSVWGYRPVTYPDVPLNTLLSNGYDDATDTSKDYRFNPIMSLNNEYRRNITTYTQFNGFVQYDIIKGLKLKISGGYTEQSSRGDVFNNSKTRYGSPISNEHVNASVGRGNRVTWLNENTLTWQTNLRKKHYFNTMLGLSFQNSDYEYYSIHTINIPNESLGMAGMAEGTPTNPGSLKSSWAMMSYFGRFNYNYKSLYYATFTMRADGSSKFRGNNRWGYFPSGSLAWNFTEEKFMKPTKKILNSGKLRLSWGLTGNNRVGEYDTWALFATLKDRIGALGTSGSIPGAVYSFNNNVYTGTAPVSVTNEALKWETTEQWNAGVDLSFLNDRISLTADVYRKTTRDLLLQATIPYSSGFTSATKNIGKVRNDGLEFTLNTINVKTKNFSWQTNFNIAFNRNKVLELAENQEAYPTAATFDQNFNTQASYIAKKGYPMGSMYGYIYEGTYKYDDFNQSGSNYTLKSTVPHFASESNTQPGMPKYRDINQDGVVDDNDRTVIGNGLPIHTGGFTNDFTYKNFDLSIFFQWSYGNDILNANRLFFESGWNKARELNQYASYVDRWTVDNPTSDIPRSTTSSSNRVFSTRIIEDGSFLRLKSVTLGFTFPNKWLARTGITKLRVYAAAQNLFTLSNYSGYDPEVSIRDSALTPGLDYSSYPRARQFNFGLNLSF